MKQGGNNGIHFRRRKGHLVLLKVQMQRKGLDPIDSFKINLKLVII
jgi:hypothetical protein